MDELVCCLCGKDSKQVIKAEKNGVVEEFEICGPNCVAKIHEFFRRTNRKEPK